MSETTIEDTCMGLAVVLASEVAINEDPVALKERLDEAAELMTVVQDSHELFKSTIAKELKRQMIARQDVLREAGLAGEEVDTTEDAKPKRRGRRPKGEKSEEMAGEHVDSPGRGEPMNVATLNA